MRREQSQQGRRQQGSDASGVRSTSGICSAQPCRRQGSSRGVNSTEIDNQLIGVLVPLVRVFLQALADNAFELHWDTGPECR